MHAECTDEVLLTRALNFMRRTHMPTYMGLRILGRQFPNDNRANLINNFIHYKLVKGMEPTFHSFKMLKSLGREPTYREAWIGSPSETLMETWLLRRLETVKMSSNVYSYMWPSKTSSQIYHYFLDGYRERNRRISERLSSAGVHVAYITDIKSYYPSIDQSALRLKVHKIFDQNLPTDLQRPAKELVEALFALAGGSGIPIGPPMCHWLGQVAMEDVDDALGSQFGDAYFRYVDDIVVIGSVPESSKIAGVVDTAVRSIGLQPNEDKTITVSARQWTSGYEQTMRTTDLAAAFNGLVADLTSYFIRNSDRERRRLKDLFREHGFSMPFFSVESQMVYNRFRVWLRIRDRIALRHTEEQLLSNAIKIRNQLLWHLEHSLYQDIENMMDRRWYVQRMKFLLGRAFYVVPLEHYQHVENLIPNIPELSPYTVLFRALRNRTPSDAYDLSGQFAALFSAIWRENNLGTHKINLSTVLPHQFDAVQVLLLYGICEATDIANSDVSASDETILKFCLGNGSSTRSLRDLSYADELNSLAIGVSREEFRSLLDTRFNMYEDYWERPSGHYEGGGGYGN